jgi:hypothetical protein
MTSLTSGQRSAVRGRRQVAARLVRRSAAERVDVPGTVGLSALGAHVAAHPGPNPPPGSHTDPLSSILGLPLATGPLGLGLAAGAIATDRPGPGRDIAVAFPRRARLGHGQVLHPQVRTPDPVRGPP